MIVIAGGGPIVSALAGLRLRSSIVISLVSGAFCRACDVDVGRDRLGRRDCGGLRQRVEHAARCSWRRC